MFFVCIWDLSRLDTLLRIDCCLALASNFSFAWIKCSLRTRSRISFKCILEIWTFSFPTSSSAFKISSASIKPSLLWSNWLIISKICASFDSFDACWSWRMVLTSSWVDTSRFLWIDSKNRGTILSKNYWQTFFQLENLCVVVIDHLSLMFDLSMYFL